MASNAFARVPRAAWLLTASALALALLAIVLAAAVRANAPSEAVAPSLVGRPLPPVALPAEQGGRLERGTRPLLPRNGHLALVLFIFSLCPRCSSEAEAVSALARQRGLDLVVVDSPAETPGIANAYAARLGLSGPILLDDSGALAARLGITVYPALLLVDARGIVRDVWIGETPTTSVAAAVARLAR